MRPATEQVVEEPLDYVETQEEPQIRQRRLTEKGRQERLSTLKRGKSNALTRVTKIRSELGRLMADENNLHLVK